MRRGAAWSARPGTGHRPPFEAPPCGSRDCPANPAASRVAGN
ncbi:hypothetical protein GR129_26790 [Streptomyces sp. HF10]|nr:hypothetical protein GR129_26790 [Streptomyces sp. HF10]